MEDQEALCRDLWLSARAIETSALSDLRAAVRDSPWASGALLTPTSLLSILECQGLPIVNGQCDPYATVTLAGPCRQVPAWLQSGRGCGGGAFLRSRWARQAV